MRSDLLPMDSTLDLHAGDSSDVGTESHCHVNGPSYVKSSTADDDMVLAGIVNTDHCSSSDNSEAMVPTCDW